MTAFDPRRFFVTRQAAPVATRGGAHVRDAANLDLAMRRLVLATIPCIIAGIVNAGYQANAAMTTRALTEIPGWRGFVLNVLNVDFVPASAWDNFWHGAMFFLPLLFVSLVVTVAWEHVFARVRGREITEGALATAILFTLTLPPTLPLWQAALGISFGVVIGREVFGGAGMNIVNPILAGRAFLYFAYPAQITSDSIWIGVDGFTGATMLAIAKTQGTAALAAADVTWSDAFLGALPGSLGETSTLACLFGAGLLLVAGLISWRIVCAAVLGLAVTAFLFNVAGSDTNPMFALPWYWHLVLGGFAFGVIFIATDPVTSPVTNHARWVYGFLIGALVVIIRVTNPAIPEGVMFAILLANIFAPTLDYFVIRANIRRRTARARGDAVAQGVEGQR